MRKLLVLVLLAAVTGVLATTAYAASRTVKVGDNYFVRSSGKPKVTVRKGTTVRWRFVGEDPHNVVVLSGPQKFRSKIKSSGVFRKKMRRRGTYNIYCSVHGASDQSMKLVVR